MHRNADGSYGMWIADQMGGSGIEVNGNTPEECAENAKPYIVEIIFAN